VSTSVAERASEFYGEQLQSVYRRRDWVFVWLFVVQWTFAIGVALVFSPYSWAGKVSTTHVHVLYAVFFGGALTLPTIFLVRAMPGATVNRHVIAVLQMMWSALFIHLTGGRIETHFHVFGSLAYLAFYRDWKVLIPATLAVAADHLIRGILWPESVYGITNPEWWRFLEHAFWVFFENVILVMGILEARREMRALAWRQAELEAHRQTVEDKVEERTAQLAQANATLNREIEERERIETELRLAQKLEAVGRLAAGIAHEINTPVQFVSDSVLFVQEAHKDLVALLEKYRGVGKAVLAGAPATGQAAEAARDEDDMELPYVLEQVPKALNRSVDGLGRVATIVRSMREFAHPDSREKKAIDINRAIDSTLVIARNEYKYVADVETDFGEIPLVTCFAGEFNQCILNIVVNAAHAIGDVVGQSGNKGKIRVETRLEGDHVRVSIADTGTGIPTELRDRIFDPFFTTKAVGKGTGQGLTVVRSVVAKHGGTVDVDSERGVGTTFRLRLPVADGAALTRAA
jgi:signal transduction histidine kinase